MGQPEPERPDQPSGPGGSSAAAAAAAGAAPHAAVAMPPPQQPAQQPQPYGGYAPPPAPGAYGGYAPPAANPPNYYAQQPAPPPQAAAHGVPLVSIISPEDARKIRKMQWVNFTATLMQLGCSLAIILIVRSNLRVVNFMRDVGGNVFVSATCYAELPDMGGGTCDYAYSLASVSIFFGFILSLMQCLTMDCCGAGRVVEAGFDAAAAAWWVAGGVTLGMRASEANAAGVPAEGARNAVVALCWISALFFLVLLGTNLVLIKRLGRAYKAAAQQLQQHMTAAPAYPAAMPGYAPGVAPGGAQQVQMAPMGHAPGPQGGFAGPQGGYAPYPPQPPQQGPPQGYPATFTPPPATGHNAV